MKKVYQKPRLRLMMKMKLRKNVHQSQRTMKKTGQAVKQKKEDASDEDDNDPKSAATAVRNIVPYGLEDFEKVVQM